MVAVDLLVFSWYVRLSVVVFWFKLLVNVVVVMDWFVEMVEMLGYRNLCRSVGWRSRWMVVVCDNLVVISFMFAAELVVRVKQFVFVLGRWCCDRVYDWLWPCCWRLVCRGVMAVVDLVPVSWWISSVGRFDIWWNFRRLCVCCRIAYVLVNCRWLL